MSSFMLSIFLSYLTFLVYCQIFLFSCFCPSCCPLFIDSCSMHFFPFICFTSSSRNHLSLSLFPNSDFLLTFYLSIPVRFHSLFTIILACFFIYCFFQPFHIVPLSFVYSGLVSMPLRFSFLFSLLFSSLFVIYILAPSSFWIIVFFSSHVLSLCCISLLFFHLFCSFLFRYFLFPSFLCCSYLLWFLSFVRSCLSFVVPFMFSLFFLFHSFFRSYFL